MTKPPRSDITLSGSLLNKKGYLDRRWTTTGWATFGDLLLLDGEVLRVDLKRLDERADKPLVRATPRAGMLEGFVRLLGASDGRVRRYAARWGLLDLCEHGLWLDHAPVTMPMVLGNSMAFIEVDTDCRGLGILGEPLWMWRYWLRQVDAILRAVASLREDRTANERDWIALHEMGPWTNVMPSSVRDENQQALSAPVMSIGGQKRAIATAVAAWMQMSGVNLTMAWNGGPPTMEFETPELLGALALQVALATTGRDTWAVCSGCGAPHAPKRRPQEGKRKYCPSCRKAKVPARDGARAYRARARAE